MRINARYEPSHKICRYGKLVPGICAALIINVCGPGQLSRYSDWLRVGRSGDQIPMGTKFSALVQTGPGAHPACCTMGTGGKERPGRDADPSSLSSAVGHERVELYLYSPYRTYGLYRASVRVQGCNFSLFTYLPHGAESFLRS
jgi:hypothetical protein